MAERIPIAFLAGLVSVLTPCVLPLVPGYLSAVSSVEAKRLGERGVSKRIALASLPFMVGFTVVFVALGAGSAAIATVLDVNRRNAIAGFVLVVLGLVFIGLLPWPERIVGSGLIGRARRRDSNALLGAAFAVCAAPCIGPVLASVLVLASNSSTVLRGSVLLFAYSLGIGVAFLLAGIAVRTGDGGLPLGARPLRRDPRRQRADAARARPAALLRQGCGSCNEPSGASLRSVSDTA